MCSEFKTEYKECEAPAREPDNQFRGDDGIYNVWRVEGVVEYKSNDGNDHLIWRE